MRLEKRLKVLLDSAKLLGLREFDESNVLEMLKYKQYNLAFEIIVTQLYEFDVEINKLFYELAVETANTLSLGDSEYLFLTELIRDENKVPQPVKDKLAVLLKTIENKY